MDQPIRRILHPTDFSEASRSAFLHALKIALAARGKLTLLHVKREGEEVEWADFPGVRDTLYRWGLLPAGAKHEAVAELGLAVRKVIAKNDDPVKACLELLEGHPSDLMVLATSQHQGRMRWLGREVSEPLAREAGVPTLLVPAQARGFVEEATGALRLRHVLVPLAQEPRPTGAVQRAHDLLEQLGFQGEVTALHVGDRSDMPALELPSGNGVQWTRVMAQGDVIPTILDRAQHADLIMMPTAGHNGFLDALRGSTTERVLREARCPLLALPA